MHYRRVRLLHGLGVLVLFAATALAATSGRPAAVGDRTIAHVLNRITFGPRPGDVELVRGMGVEAFIDRQLQVTTDFRSVFTEIASVHLGVANTNLVFPGFVPPPGSRLGIIIG